MTQCRVSNASNDSLEPLKQLKPHPRQEQEQQRADDEYEGYAVESGSDGSQRHLHNTIQEVNEEITLMDNEDGLISAGLALKDRNDEPMIPSQVKVSIPLIHNLPQGQ